MLKPLSVLKLGDRVDAASVVDGDAKATLAIVGSFGVAVVRVADDGSATTLWHDTFVNARNGSCGRCCHGLLRCLVSVSANGMSFVSLPFTGGTALATFDASGTVVGTRTMPLGHSVTSLEVIGDGLTDVQTVNPSVSVAWTYFYDSNTGREPMVMPSLKKFSFDLTTETFGLWSWSAHVYRCPGPCNGRVADARAECIIWNGGKDGPILLARSDGGHAIYSCQTRDPNRTTSVLGWDSYTIPSNMQAQAISYIGRMVPGTGQVSRGFYNVVRLSSTKGNSIRTRAGAVDFNTGNVYLAQTASCCIPNMENLTINGHQLAPTGDGMVLQVVTPDFERRLTWHHFASPMSAKDTGSTAVDVDVAGGFAVFTGYASQNLITADPLTGTKAPSVAVAEPPQGYIALIPTLDAQ